MSFGLTFNIQQFSTEDGPGIRTTVFFKGCPLRCPWCHNPEGLHAAGELMWYAVRCLGAQDCLNTCPEKALLLTPGGMEIDRQRCTLCGRCAKACPAGALEIIGRPFTSDELLAELLKDSVFYETSGGGVTFSGGEPLMQADFLTQMLPRCKKAGMHTALDTSGAVAWERLEAILPWVDLVLFDLKIMDRERHKRVTGVSNEIILKNAGLLSAQRIPMWIRTPVIPGYTDEVENIRAIGAFIREALPTVRRWDLLAYTNLGRPKYQRLDRPYLLEKTPLLTPGEMESLHQAAVELVPEAVWSGATR
ncbi:MAG: glycyl-radical enzyme activating protein [Deltaproteobacteria bacterium]|nr:glycyl-radical enzyme activating protein [Deltaproteobacteria bacterium]